MTMFVEDETRTMRAKLLQAYQWNNQQELGIAAEGWDAWQNEVRELLAAYLPEVER
jgi:hypothetical protein